MNPAPYKSPFFTLIMPVYGVERYIADSIADLLTQTFRDFELIVVDDCSPDRSIAIVEELAANDPRVAIVRHDRNRGVSRARNTGMQHAGGTWLMFPDPDDRYDANMLEIMHHAIESSPADLFVFAHTQEYYDRANNHLYDNPIALEAGHHRKGPELACEAIALEQQTHLGYPWNKAYRAEIVRDFNLQFEDDVPLIEDILFNVAYLYHCDSITTIAESPYRYAKRLRTNLTAEFVPNYFEMHHRRIKVLRDFVEAQGALDDNAKSILGALHGRFILSSIEQNTNSRSHLSTKQQREWLERLFEDELFVELIPHAEARNSKVLAICLEVLKRRNIPALLALGNCIHFVRNHGTTLYTKVKSGR